MIATHRFFLSAQVGVAVGVAAGWSSALAQSPSSAPVPNADRASTRSLVSEAQRALSSGDYARAMSLYEECEKRLGDDPALLSRLAYNRAQALFGAKDYESAIHQFNQALANANEEIERRTPMWLGECNYQLADAGRAKPEQLESALEKATAARDFFRSVVRSDATDANARARLRDAASLLAEIRKQLEQKKEEQQKQQSGDDKDKKDDQSSQPSSQPQNEKESKDSEQDQKDQKQKQSQSGKPQEQKQQQASEQKGEKKEDQAQQAKQGDKDKPDQQAGKEGKPVKLTMSKEEAQRLLQLIRDKERKRREQQMRLEQQRARSVPVDKDW